jgi:hypothetical protein
LLAPDAKIVCESAASEDVFAGDEALASCFEVLRTAKYGVAYVTVLRYTSNGGEGEA